MTERDQWRVVTLNQIGRIVTGKTPPSRNPAYFNGNVPFVTPSDLDGRRQIGTTKRYLTSAGADVVAGAKIPSGSVMVSCIGSDMGKSAIAPQSSVTNQQINSIIVDPAIDALYVHYNLSNRRNEIRSAGVGSAVPIMNKTAFGNLEISLPPLQQQRRIAHILGTLDDKIELNRRMNVILESMAHALFKSWFVDFEPVRAKMEGRWLRGESPPGMPAEMYDLFPERLVPSELGDVPEGWEVKTLDQLIDLNPREPLRRGTKAPYLNMAALPTSGCNPDDTVLREYTVGMRFRNRDTLLARITPCLENGKTAYVQSLPADAVGWGSTEFIVMRAIPPVTSEYTYLLARDEAFRAHAIQSMTGTSGRQRVQAQVLLNYRLPSPQCGIWSAFSLLIEPMFVKTKVLSEESRTLAVLRNVLLPKLVSGQIHLRRIG